MNVQTISEKRVLCPSCGKTGKRASPVTVRALLREQYAEGIVTTEHSCCDTNGNRELGCKPTTVDTDWRFCDSPNCDVVYFSEEDDTRFTKSQLKIPVGVK